MLYGQIRQIFNKAQELGVNVVAVNNSWGGAVDSEIFEKLVNVTGKQGAVSVYAAGNSASDNDSESVFPANI